MIILNDPITVNGREYELYLQVTSKDGKEPHSMELLELMEKIIIACETYQDQIK